MSRTLEQGHGENENVQQSGSFGIFCQGENLLGCSNIILEGFGINTKRNSTYFLTDFYAKDYQNLDENYI